MTVSKAEETVAYVVTYRWVQMCSGGSEVVPRLWLVCWAGGEQCTVLLIAPCSLTEIEDEGRKKILPNQTNWKTTHHETRRPTWSLNAFETKVSWGALQAKIWCQVPLINIAHVYALAYSSAARREVLPLVCGNGKVQLLKNSFPTPVLQALYSLQKTHWSPSPGKLYADKMSLNFKSRLSTLGMHINILGTDWCWKYKCLKNVQVGKTALGSTGQPFFLYHLPILTGISSNKAYVNAHSFNKWRCIN